MKKIKTKIIVLILFFVFLSSNAFAINSESLSGISACLMDKQTGQILLNKNMHLKHPPASLTKILTAVVVLEKGELSETVKVSRKAAYQEGSSIYLEEGEEITLEELLYGILLASGNDASVAAAEHIAGSVENFAKLMNNKAVEIGAKNSNFVNPNGLPHRDHYSTAYDLALIMKYALKIEKFSEISSTKYKTISWGNNNWDRGLRNHNKLLWSYDNITAGKTGYTKAAGRCLINSARKNEREVIAVVLNSPDDWLDCTKLLNHGLDNFRNIEYISQGEKLHTLHVEKAEDKNVNLLAENPIYLTVPINDKISVQKKFTLNSEVSLPVKKGDKLGKVAVYQNQILTGKSALLSEKNLKHDSIFMRIWSKISHILK